jgi:hypothetical protein
MNDLLVPRWFMVSCLIGHRERNWMTQQAPAGVIFVARGLPRTPIAPGSPSDQLQKQADLSVKVEPASEWVPPSIHTSHFLPRFVHHRPDRLVVTGYEPCALPRGSSACAGHTLQL